jgi:hypothetical protein
MAALQNGSRLGSQGVGACYCCCSAVALLLILLALACTHNDRPSALKVVQNSEKNCHLANARARRELRCIEISCTVGHRGTPRLSEEYVSELACRCVLLNAALHACAADTAIHTVHVEAEQTLFPIVNPQPHRLCLPFDAATNLLRATVMATVHTSHLKIQADGF